MILELRLMLNMLNIIVTFGKKIKLSYGGLVNSVNGVNNVRIELAVKGGYTAQKMKFSITDFFSKGEQIRRFLRIWSHLLKKSVMENFIFLPIENNHLGI